MTAPAKTSSVAGDSVAHEPFPTTNAGILNVLRDLHGGIPDSWHTGSERHRFWSNVRKTETCWLWAGTISSGQYGLFRRDDGKHVKAHRHAYELHHGTAPGALFVCHRCDNPPCVRPDHLFLGTAADNDRDKREKGRDQLNWRADRLRKMAIAASLPALALLSACHDPHTLSTARQLVEVGGMLVVSAVVIWAIAALVGFAFEREPALDDTTDELDVSVVHHEIRTTIAGSYCQVRCICGQWNATVPTLRGARELFHLHVEHAHALLAGGAA